MLLAFLVLFGIPTKGFAFRDDCTGGCGDYGKCVANATGTERCVCLIFYRPKSINSIGEKICKLDGTMVAVITTCMLLLLICLIIPYVVIWWFQKRRKRLKLATKDLLPATKSPKEEVNEDDNVYYEVH
ncbi:hypothetical protein EG68_03693 [Paragonimus skrjabini miyazakii]|uniref:EGF-like domain-containing protein n=1 Tax=Paragonimus skrjabini miyazakii TaxID=59628 RepID=A0A8S9Z5J9_9TREM|nr:hypothetical protein EG68_03693 [Paragonimus skrjabini miyazakii]